MAGIEAEGSAKLSHTLAYIVYVLILIPVIITALQVLEGGFMILNELGIAAEIVDTASIILIAAFAIAFGIGGRESAGRLLRKPEEKKEER